MTYNELYEIDKNVYHEIQDIKRERELETNAFIEGMEKGADLMLKRVKEFLKKEDENK